MDILWGSIFYDVFWIEGLQEGCYMAEIHKCWDYRSFLKLIV
jgi:hypothetical protein